MASVSVDHAVIRTGTPAEVAKYLRDLRFSTADPALITSDLHDAVARGSIPHAVFTIWTPLHRNAESTIAGLRQSESLLERKTAIKAFIKAVRSPNAMAEMWDAAGGASGVAAIMSDLSVNEIRLFCNGLAKTASLPGKRAERHVMLTELVDLLCADANSHAKNPDTRPLGVYYRRILPACTTDKVAKHEETRPTWSQRQQSILFRTHPSFYEAKFLDSIFSQDSHGIDFNTWTHLINNDFSFAKKLLSRLNETKGPLPLKSHDFVQLAEAIAKRLRRRRSAGDENLPFEILELLVEAFKKNTDAAEYLNTSLNGVIFYVVKFWEHTRTTRPNVQQHLAELIGLAPVSNFKSAKDLVTLLRIVNSSVSYRLFRLIIQSSKDYRFDVEDASGEANDSLRKLKGPWPADVFTMFSDDDPDASLRLFRKLMAVFPDAQFLQASTLQRQSIVECPREPETKKGNVDILEALLVRASPTSPVLDSDLMDRIKSRVESCKEKAAMSRDWIFRLGWTRIAIDLSVAAGSLELFEGVLLWARRFNKDRNTVVQLYSADTLHRVEIIDLLSGNPSFGRQDGLKSDVRRNIDLGSKILLQLLETAAMAIREPSFQQYDWNDILNFPSKVVERRLVSANDVQSNLRLSDDETYEIFWKPTLELLVEAEKYLLKPGMQRLYPRDIKGLFHNVDFDFEKSLRPHSARFLDTLSRARDELWRELRPQHFPAVHDLGPAWPRGLSVQYLCPSEMKDVSLLPFVRSRVEAVVFGNPDVLLEESPNDQEFRATIGPFVDDYVYALGIYTGSASNKEDRDYRIRKAWRHAVDNLTGERMTRTESLRFWHEVFVDQSRIKLLRDIQVELPRPSGPTIPSADNPDIPIEWMPEPCSEDVDADSRDIPATVLDRMITHGHPWANTTVLDVEVSWTDSVWISPEHPTSFWSMERLGKPVSWGSKDGFFLAIVLYLNTLEGSDTSILKEAFPSKTDTRYPALYLDQEFMDAVDTDYFGYGFARQTSNMIASGPALLVARVARSVLGTVEKIEKSGSHDVAPVALAMRLIRLLAGSDQPSLAFPLIRDVILDRPNDSAWHRQLLNKGLFNKLPPSETKKLLGTIADGIQEKLDMQDANNKAEAEKDSADSAGSPSLVKVSTVKMLAKLLSDSPFLDFRSSLGILSHLLDKAKHIDVRIAIIESLYGTLGAESTSTDIKDEILLLLEKHAVPLAAAFNERGPSWATWEQIEAGEDLPQVINRSMGAETPVRQMFMTWDSRFPKDKHLRQKLAAMTTRVIEQSAENNRRWTELFLKRYEFSLNLGEDLPRVPVDARMLILFGRNPEFLTGSVFEIMRDSVLTQISPPPGIASITKQVRRSPGLSDSDAGKHWLSLYGTSGQSINNCGIDQALRQMHRPIGLEACDSSDRVTMEMLQHLGNEIFEKLLQGGMPQVESLFRAMTPKDYLETDREVLARWKAAALPVLENVIVRVEQLRTPQWQRDPRRKPHVLPDAFRLKATMTIFDFPVEIGHDDVFVKEVLGLISVLAETRASYHANWEYVKQKAFYVNQELRIHLMRLGIRFGSLDDIDVENPTLADYLRVDLAKFLVERGHPQAPKDKTEISDLKKMLRSWAESPVEDFRNSAREMVLNLKRSRDCAGFTRGGYLRGARTGAEDSDSDEDSD
ncbi:hypothetical protein CkaCkLH20_02307 [Colletotrichum karsti]|uniref:Uncharacterized protein n=1 Tax=Colletotrichum karsti TaxID=1095194 RepID=A0A9P6ICI6_9PEZI|nr:uncharacterized protein CkaCkLH20_02307 [Colletotrichum karsti]KAF9880353.1 hypothetical protein CkaCkLH20_02307 [Colletotrichum karsti]